MELGRAAEQHGRIARRQDPAAVVVSEPSALRSEQGLAQAPARLEKDARTEREKAERGSTSPRTPGRTPPGGLSMEGWAWTP